MKPEIDFKERVAIVTGGARGIGKEIARKFIQHGASVIIADLLIDEGKSTAEELGSAASFCRCDISNFKDIQHLITGTVEKYERLDILVNNAALNCY